MNVLMLAPEFLPCWGGVGVYISEIARNMPQNVEIHILTPNRENIGNGEGFNGNLLGQEFPKNVHIHYIGTAKDSFVYNFIFQINCKRLIQKLLSQFDIDIIHSTSAMPDLFISPLKLKIPIITTIHTTIAGQLQTLENLTSNRSDLELSEKMTYILGPVLKRFENAYYTKKRNYITVSKWAKNNLLTESKINLEKIRVIHNGVDSEIYKPYSKKIASTFFPQLSDIDVPKILFLSRIIDSKGITNLLRAIPNICKNEDVHFIIAGPGKIISTSDLGDNATYLGYVPHTITQYLYSLSDIFILPSLSENFPLSVLEAMASENAVIASNVGGIPEMITHGENGYLIPPNDVSAIEVSITELIKNESLRKKIAQNGRKTVIEQFNWNRAAISTKQYYEEIING